MSYKYDYCSSLTSVTIPNSVTSIGGSAFSGCSGLTSVTIPNSVTSLGREVFYGCSSLSSVVVDSENPKYDSRENCNAIIETATNTLIAGCKSTVIPNSVTTIGEIAFYGSGLVSIEIPSSVTKIDFGAFCSCSELTSITVNGGNTTYDSRGNCNAIIETATNALIAGCKNTVIPNSVTYIGDDAFFGCSGITSIIIPNSVMTIGGWAFFGCTGLTSVSIGSGVELIGQEAFRGCDNLTNAEFASIESLCSIKYDHLFDSYDDYWNIYDYFTSNPLKYAKHLFINGVEVTDVVIPNSVTAIGNWAFAECSCITSVTISEGVTSIGDVAFWLCPNLTSVTIPTSVTSIGEYAFWHCTNLASVETLSNVTTIGKNAFEYTAWLNTWYNNQPDGLIYLGKTAYKYKGTMPENTSIVLKNGTVKIEDSAFEGCTGLTSVTIPESMLTIGKSAFEGCTGLTKAEFASIESLCNISFAVDGYSNPLSLAQHLYINGTEVTDVVIPNSVTSIGQSAFDTFSGLTSVTIPNSVTSIGDYAFYDCSNLTSVKVDIEIPFSINGETFYNCTNATLHVPYGSKAAYESAFHWKDFHEIIEDFEGSAGGAGEFGQVADVVDLGLSVKWASWNMGAAQIGDYGRLYGIGDPTGRNTSTSTDDYHYVANTSICGTEYDLAYTKWGERWRLPSADELNELVELCSWEHNVTINGVKGSVATGPNGNTLFFPYTGSRRGTSNPYKGAHASIWSGNTGFANEGCESHPYYYVDMDINLPEGFVRFDGDFCYDGQSIRPVYVGYPDIDVTNISQMDNVIYIEPTEVWTNTQKTLSLKMKNTAAIRGFQFDLYLPDGVTVVKSGNGRIQGSLSAGRLPNEDAHTLTFSEQTDGAIRFLCSSLYDETFTGNDGEIATLQINIPDGMIEDDYPIQLKNMKLTETNISNYYETPLVQTKLTVSTYVSGDISGDGVVDVSDYTGVANFIHGNTPEGFNAKAADVDGNNAIDVSDYTGIANIIHTGSIYGSNGNNSNNAPALMLSPRKANTDLSTYDNVIYISPFTASAGTQTSISIKMKNTAAIRGFQFDLYLPDGMSVVKSNLGRIQGSLSAGRLPNGDEHTLTFSEQADGAIRFLCSSQYDETFTGNDGEIATLLVNIDANMADGDYPLQLKNMKLTETDISKFYTADLIETTVTIGATDNRTILDETFTTAPASATNVDVRVRRKIKADEWSTLCLPFAMDETQVKAAFGDDVQLAEFKGWAATDWDANDNTTAIDVTFANATAITANKPYIIKVSQAINEFTADGVDVAPEDEPTVTVGKTNRGTFGSFTGSYVPITIDEECLFLSDNQFWYSTGKTKMKAYRAYFYFQDVLVSYSSGSNAKIGYTINDDVDNISLTPGPSPKGEGSIYDLQGRKIKNEKVKSNNDRALPKGVYIVNGKKVVIK